MTVCFVRQKKKKKVEEENLTESGRSSGPAVFTWSFVGQWLVLYTVEVWVWVLHWRSGSGFCPSTVYNGGLGLGSTPEVWVCVLH